MQAYTLQQKSAHTERSKIQPQNNPITKAIIAEPTRLHTAIQVNLYRLDTGLGKQNTMPKYPPRNLG